MFNAALVANKRIPYGLSVNVSIAFFLKHVYACFFALPGWLPFHSSVVSLKYNIFAINPVCKTNYLHDITLQMWLIVVMFCSLWLIWLAIWRRSRRVWEKRTEAAAARGGSHRPVAERRRRDCIILCVHAQWHLLLYSIPPGGSGHLPEVRLCLRCHVPTSISLVLVVPAEGGVWHIKQIWPYTFTCVGVADGYSFTVMGTTLKFLS